MFGFNKEKRLIENPVSFEAAIEINRPASEVFALIDLSNPHSHLAQQGAKIERVDGNPETFSAVLPELDDIRFIFTVLDKVEGKKHTLECVMEPQAFALVKSVEEHTIAPVGNDACCVNLTTTATFDNDLSDGEIAGEIAVMSEAVTRDLEKLKLLAEEGIEAVKAYDEEDLEICFELGELDIDWDQIEPEQ